MSDIEIIEADLSTNRYTIGIVAAKWNSFVTDRMLEGALELLQSKGIANENITLVRCPGAYEIPLTVKMLLDHVDGVIALGAVIRGETPHFEYVCDAVNKGISELNLSYGKPISFGVLTTDDIQQATERAESGSSKGNKGAGAALALLEMLSITQQIEDL